MPPRLEGSARRLGLHTCSLETAQRPAGGRCRLSGKRANPGGLGLSRRTGPDPPVPVTARTIRRQRLRLVDRCVSVRDSPPAPRPERGHEPTMSDYPLILVFEADLFNNYGMAGHAPRLIGRTAESWPRWMARPQDHLRPDADGLWPLANLLTLAFHSAIPGRDAVPAAGRAGGRAGGPFCVWSAAVGRPRHRLWQARAGRQCRRPDPPGQAAAPGSRALCRCRARTAGQALALPGGSMPPPAEAAIDRRWRPRARGRTPFPNAAAPARRQGARRHAARRAGPPFA